RRSSPPARQLNFDVRRDDKLAEVQTMIRISGQLVDRLEEVGRWASNLGMLGREMTVEDHLAAALSIPAGCPPEVKRGEPTEIVVPPEADQLLSGRAEASQKSLDQFVTDEVTLYLERMGNAADYIDFRRGLDWLDEMGMEGYPV